MTRPSPLNMPRRKRSELFPIEEAGSEPSVDDLTAQVLANVEGLSWLLPQIGVDDPEAEVAAWRARIGGHLVARICTQGPKPEHVTEQWNVLLSERPPINLMELFAFEAAVGKLPLAFAPSGPMSVARVLQGIYWRLGVGLYAHAKTLTFQRPYVTVRALELSRTYLRLFVESSRRDGAGIVEARGRMATAVALINRYTPAREAELRDAEQQMLLTMESRDLHPQARAYLAELRLGLFDLTGDRGFLVDVITESTSDDSPSLRVSHLEAYVRLACIRTTDDLARKAYWHEAQDIASNVHHWDLAPEAYVRLRILRECVQAAATKDPRVTVDFLQGTRLPFEVHRRIRETPADDEDAEWLSSRVVRTLRHMRGFLWTPIIRRIYADCCRARANSLPEGDEAVERYLAESVLALDAIDESVHPEPSTRLHLGNDLLKLSAVTGNSALRARGLSVLVEAALTSARDASPLVLIGADIESRGPANLDMENLPGKWREQISEGDFRAMYRHAAERALNSADLTRRYLGSRESVLMIDDHLELASGVIVFKGTTRANRLREEVRLSALAKTFTERNLTSYALPEVIGVYELDRADATFGPQGEVVTMLRFANGETLSELGPAMDATGARLVFSSAAELLGLIHSQPAMRGGPPRSPRRRLKTAEIGLWLRNLLGDAGQAEFEEWWALVVDLPTLPKRDAHPGNWIAGKDGRITALDFESAGECPLGWEIAQLTDDVPVFPVDDEWLETRMAIVNVYADSLRSNGVEVKEDELRRGFAAGLVARAVRSMTDPAQNSAQRVHGRALLQAVARADLGGASIIAERWTDGAARAKATLSRGRATATSKAVAYILRHDLSVARDPNGWVEIDVVLRRAREVGRPVSSQELMSVATLAKERRFEVLEGKMRARYGHSMDIDTSEATRGEQAPRLFHASSLNALDAIFGKREGLRPMKRARCHLSSSPDAARIAGERHPAPILLTVRAGGLDEFERASELTWLAMHVSSESLEVVPIPEQFQLRIRRFRI